jgi:uncharacterized protein (DUF433 family)
MIRKAQLRSESVGGEPYEYVPLGEFIVSAPAVCRGRPTFKYTRIEVAGVLQRLAAGHLLDDLVSDYKGRVTHEAIKEAADLAGQALVHQTLRPAHP